MGTGIIHSVNPKEVNGIILDENDQDIVFFISELTSDVYKFARVAFEIELTSSGLRAVCIRRIS
jgi:hypothetical protein